MLSELDHSNPASDAEVDFRGTSGPRTASIAIVGEAWGADEEVALQPFVGLSGQELTRMLAEAGIRRDDCFITNVIPARPPHNEMWRFFFPIEKKPSYSLLRGLAPRKNVRASLENLYRQLRAVRPRLVICLGNYAFWALSSECRVSRLSPPNSGPVLVPSGIDDFRGSMLISDVIPGLRLLPTYHPAAIMRMWSFRAPAVHDLRTRVPRALRDDWTPCTPPNLRFSMAFEETLDALEDLHRRLQASPVWFSNDIETRNRLITCIGFGLSSTSAFTIPLVRRDASLPSGFSSHWTAPQETQITRRILDALSHPNARIIGQNYLYDMTYLWHTYGVRPRVAFDTMSAQHLMFPGTPKDLGYLSSLYCRYHRYWKDDNKEWDAKTDMHDHLRYNAEDCIRTFEIFEAQRPALDQLKLGDLWQLELQKYEMAFEMSVRGVRIDLEMKAQLGIELAEAAASRIHWLEKIIPPALIAEALGPQKTSWVTSPKQQKFIFYELFNLPAQRHRKTGAITLDKEALPKLKRQAPYLSRIVDTLLELRSIEVFASTFVHAPIDPDGRMRTSFNPAGPETYRWSSSKNPLGTGGNMQNLPSGKEL